VVLATARRPLRNALPAITETRMFHSRVACPASVVAAVPESKISSSCVTGSRETDNLHEGRHAYRLRQAVEGMARKSERINSAPQSVRGPVTLRPMPCNNKPVRGERREQATLKSINFGWCVQVKWKSASWDIQALWLLSCHV